MPALLANDRVADQRLVTASLTGALARVWRLLSPGDMRRSYPVYRDAAGAIIDSHAQTSALLASEFYESLRADSPARKSFIPDLADGPNDEQIDASLRWALDSLFTGQPDLDLAAAEKRVVAAAQKMTADAARDTITEAADSDPEAIGWVRHAEPTACYFCALLATRSIGKDYGSNAVYHTRESALYRHNSRPKMAHGGKRERGKTYVAPTTYSDESYHDHCHCTAVPVFDGQDYSPPDYVSEWDALYRAHGYENGYASINAFRRAYENPPGAE